MENQTSAQINRTRRRVSGLSSTVSIGWSSRWLGQSEPGERLMQKEGASQELRQKTEALLCSLGTAPRRPPHRPRGGPSSQPVLHLRVGHPIIWHLLHLPRARGPQPATCPLPVWPLLVMGNWPPWDL